MASVPAPEEAESLSRLELLRGQGQAGLDELLLEYDARPAGADKEALADLVDQVAAQRYATVSRLFWHTDLETAKAVAKREAKPILSLRMLGRLDEDLSCANSRLFRVVLYSNREVAKTLRSKFVLHWSSERAVPKVTVDYGDGRVIKTTIAGNSAHYILDAEGRPIDVLPGLYGPDHFLRALEPIVDIAAKLRVSDANRGQLLRQHHLETKRQAESLYASSSLQIGQRLRRQSGTFTLAQAEMGTVSKAVIEQPMVRTVRLGQPLAKLASEESIVVELALANREPVKLDEASRALIKRLGPTDWSATPKRVAEEKLDTLIQQLEFNIAADTVLNELGMRHQIHDWFLKQPNQRFADLNKRIYRDLFLTPASDPWLGMATPNVFTGLPSDGLEAANKRADGAANMNAPRVN